MRFAVLAILAIVLPSLAHAQDGPSFDCKQASSRVEKAICGADGFGMGWIDQTMAELYKAALARPGADNTAIRASQRNWLAQRDRCTGTGEKMTNCLIKSYRTRFVELAAPYDPAHITGTYTSPPINGEVEAVLFPDHSLVAQIDSNRGPPSYNLCHLEIRAAGQGTRFHAADSTDDSDPKAPVCKVDLTAGRASLTIEQSGCSDDCGNGADFAGTYQR